MNWQDITSYSQTEKWEDATPRLWEVRIGKMSINVHRVIHLNGWWLTCHELGIKMHELKHLSIDRAKIEGLQTVISVLENKSAEYLKAIGEIYAEMIE